VEACGEGEDGGVIRSSRRGKGGRKELN
jgi:hypothetical protein